MPRAMEREKGAGQHACVEFPPVHGGRRAPQSEQCNSPDMSVDAFIAMRKAESGA